MSDEIELEAVSMDIPERGYEIQRDPEEDEANQETAPIVVEPEPEKTDPIATREQEIRLDKISKANTQVGFIDPIAFAQMKIVAQEFVKDGAVSPDVKNASQMLMKLQAGSEMGMGITESLNSLYIVNGKITIFGQAVIGRIKKGGWSVAYQEGADNGVADKEWCKAIVYRGGKPKYDEDFNFAGFDEQPDEIYTHTMLFSDAKASDGANGPGWKLGRNRALKLRYGAVSAILKTYLPELLGGTSDVKEAAEDYRTTKEDVALRIEQATKKKMPKDFTPKIVVPHGK